jgi:hypothetical protein
MHLTELDNSNSTEDIFKIWRSAFANRPDAEITGCSSSRGQ